MVYVPAVTWSNHWNVLRDAGCDARPYTYLDGIKLDWPKLWRISSKRTRAPSSCCICARTTQAEWILLRNNGGSSPRCARGSVSCRSSTALIWASRRAMSIKDAAPFRLFCEQGLQPWACISFSKNFGLYSERAGAVVASCASGGEAAAVRGHLGKLARASVFKSARVRGPRRRRRARGPGARGAVARVPRGHVGAHRGHAGEAAEPRSRRGRRATGLCTAWESKRSARLLRRVCSTA